MSSTVKRPWTKEDDQRLIWYWGTRRPEAVAKLLDRTVYACKSRIHRLTGKASSRRGLYSQRQLSEETGYPRKALRRAARALNISVRAKGKQPWRLTEDQKDRVLNWLANEEGSLTGLTFEEAADELGLTSEWVSELASRLGIDAMKGAKWAQLTSKEVEQIRGLAFRKKQVVEGTRWAVKYECCVSCGTDEKAHKARGLCRSCYDRRRKLDKHDPR